MDSADPIMAHPDDSQWWKTVTTTYVNANPDEVARHIRERNSTRGSRRRIPKVIRKLEIMGVLVALHAGCSNQNKKTDPPVDNKDAPQVVVTQDAPSAAPLTDEQLHKLFVDAVYCRGACPERDQFRELKRASPDRVAAVALAIMAEPDSRTDSGIGLEAMYIVDEWLRAGLDEAARKRAAQALVKVAAEGSEFMRYQAHANLAEYRLPGARQILLAEVENPKREGADRASAAGALGIVIGEDFTLIRTWLRDDQPHHWEAALAMMRTFETLNADHRGLWKEGRDLLIALGKRPQLPAGVVYDLAWFYDFYIQDGDAEALALAKRWSKHPDDAAAGQMIKILP